MTLLLAAVLVSTAPQAQSTSHGGPEAALLGALRPTGAGDRQERAGAAIRAYKAQGVLPFRPQRSGYSDFYRATRPTQFMGNELVLVMEEYMTKYVGCCVNPGAGVYVRITVGLDAMKAFARLNKCRVEEFADRQALMDVVPVAGAFEPGRYAALSCQESDETASAALAAPAQQAPAARLAAPSSASPLIGEWTCLSRKSDGSGYTSGFKFDADGLFAYMDAQSKIIGSFQPLGLNAAVTADSVTAHGKTMPSNMKVEISTLASGPGHVSFEMRLVRLSSFTFNRCVSMAVAAQTPAPKVNVCEINPAACAALQRNQDIRSQLQDQRCDVLRSQLAGTMGGDYQLAKAGCR